jgi:AcrR family transcriptional regulator
MPKLTTTGRSNQRMRARKDLLQAAARLLQGGHKPSMEEVAAEAMVSRATAYRYFPNLEALLAEAPLDGDAPDPQILFAADSEVDPAERIDKAEAALHAMCYRNETSLRVMMAHSLESSLCTGGRKAPLRQNRRADLIAAALAPARGRFSKANYARLCAALSLIFGPEAMVVFRDVLPLAPAEARRVKSWAIRALVQAALRHS